MNDQELPGIVLKLHSHENNVISDLLQNWQFKSAISGFGRPFPFVFSNSAAKWESYCLPILTGLPTKLALVYL